MDNSKNSKYVLRIQAFAQDIIQCSLCPKPIKLSRFPYHLNHCHSSNINPLKQCFWCFGLYKFNKSDRKSPEVNKHLLDCLERFRVCTLLKPFSRDFQEPQLYENGDHSNDLPSTSHYERMSIDPSINVPHSSDCSADSKEPQLIESMSLASSNTVPHNSDCTTDEQHLYESIDPESLNKVPSSVSLSDPNLYESTFPQSSSTIATSSKEPSFLDRLELISREKNEKVRHFNTLALHLRAFDYMAITHNDKWHVKNCHDYCKCQIAIANPKKFFLLRKDSIVEIRGKGWHFQNSCVWARMVLGEENYFVYKMETFCECAKRFACCKDW